MLLLIDKPSGITSHDAISAAKKYIRQHFSPEKKIKIWHAGTLDPMATGLIIAATDADTKQLHTLTWSDKSYETTIDFSQRSDTWDLDYRKMLEPIDPSTYEDIPPLSQIQEILDTLIGNPNLPLTPFSAKKVDGKKLYEYAREWNPIFLTVPMTIYGYKVIEYQFPLLKLKLHVWSGTYIRSIGHWLGTQIGGDAILTSLRRISISNYSLELLKQKTIYTWQRDDLEVKFVILE